MFDGYYPINLEVNQSLVNLPDVKSSDHLSRGLDITRTLGGVVQNTAGQAIYLNAHTPDNRTIFQVADVIDTNTGHYMVTYPDSMLRVAGACSIELTIVDATGTISTNTGIVNIVEAVANYSDIQDSPDYPALLTALNTIQNMQTQINAMQTQVDNIEGFPTGATVFSATTLSSTHWIPLDGRSTASYPSLATIYGANLPDFTGRVPVQIDSTQTEFNTLSKTGGEKNHTLSIDEIPSHKHGFFAYRSIDENNGHYSLLPQGYNGYNGFADRCMVFLGSSEPGKAYIDVTGGGTTHNNLQPYIVCGKWYVHL